MARVRIVLLGALDGALFTAIVAVVLWRLRAWEFERNIAEAAAVGNNPVLMVAHERWESIAIILIIIFAVTALVVDRVWTRNRSTVLFWLATGVVAIAMWNVLVMVGFWTEGSMTMYAKLTSGTPLYGPSSLGIVLVVNLAFGLGVGLTKRLVTKRTEPVISVHGSTQT